MEPNPKALQQWAHTVLHSDYWEYLIDNTRMSMVEALLSAVNDGQKDHVELISHKLLALEEITARLLSASVDVSYKRDYDEVLDDAE